MPTLHAHGNTNISKIWFVVLAAFISMVWIVGETYASIKAIENDTQQTLSQLDQLIKE